MIFLVVEVAENHNGAGIQHPPHDRFFVNAWLRTKHHLTFVSHTKIDRQIDRQNV